MLTFVMVARDTTKATISCQSKYQNCTAPPDVPKNPSALHPPHHEQICFRPHYYQTETIEKWDVLDENGLTPV